MTELIPLSRKTLYCDFLLSSDDCWFHCTTQPYAYSIQNYGIIPQGSQHQNVSHSNRGFYLSHTYQAAGDWAIKMCSIGGSMNILATVLIFKLSCD